MDKLRAIKLFCHVVEAKSFAATAHDLNIAPSVLSKTIAALEVELCFTLFNRSTRRLSLTEAGATYYERCRQLLIELDEAEVMAREGVVQAKGTLRFGVHPAFRAALVQNLGAFLANHPEVQIETVVTNSPTALLDDGLDVVIAVGDLADSGFVVQRIGWTTVIVCAAPDYLDRHGRADHPRDLEHYRAIIPGRRDEDSFARWTFTRDGQQEEVHVPVAFVARDGVGLVDAAMGGAGVGRIYDLSAGPLLRAGALEAILPEWDAGRQPVHAVLPSRRNVPAKVRAFLEFTHSLLRETEAREGETRA